MSTRSDRWLSVLLTSSVLLALVAGCSSQKSAEQGAN